MGVPLLESIASARIEGNHTTLADYIESKVAAPEQPSDELKEIENIESAMRYVEEAASPSTDVTEHFIRELHTLTVAGLVREGDPTPGAYRNGTVRIAQAQHLPPEAVQVSEYMRELTTFMNRVDPPKYDLMKVALAHHRFAWIHPFTNGNGRVVRLLTYALLMKYGFRVSAAGRLLNPAAVFCADRARYYAALSQADAGSDAALEDWCTYVLTGVRDELKKVDRLAEYEHLKAHVLLPTVTYARERNLITAQEEALLAATVRAGVVKAANLETAMSKLNATQRTYQIRKLVASGMLQPIAKGARQYTIGFNNNTLLRGVIRALEEQGFISPALQALP